MGDNAVQALKWYDWCRALLWRCRDAAALPLLGICVDATLVRCVKALPTALAISTSHDITFSSLSSLDVNARRVCALLQYLAARPSKTDEKNKN